MSKPRILVVGATGRTGSAIVNGLLEAGETVVEALIRPISQSKPSILQLKQRGVIIHVADIKDSPELVSILTGISTVVSAIGPGAHLEQISLADASKKANVKVFIPCAFMTPCPPEGVMWIRDQKEQIYQHIRSIGLPYTIIDVGYWYQASFPTLPSGRVDYASLVVPNVTIFGDKDLKTALIDLRDIGPYVAKIVRDPRTVNKYVFCYGDLLSQEEAFGELEQLSGELIERNYVSRPPKFAASENMYCALVKRQNELTYVLSIQIPADHLDTLLQAARGSFKYDFSNMQQAITLIGLEYSYSKFVRGDNSPEYARSMGYLVAQDLYPDFIPRPFVEFVTELLNGKAAKTYQETFTRV